MPHEHLGLQGFHSLQRDADDDDDGRTADGQVPRRCQVLGDYGGNGEITKKLTVQASAFSASAKEKIEAAGGKVEVV